MQNNGVAPSLAKLLVYMYIMHVKKRNKDDFPQKKVLEKEISMKTSQYFVSNTFMTPVNN